MTLQRAFSTEAEAHAFIEGVNYVNDSAITVLGIVYHSGDWIVQLEDADAADPEEAIL